MIIIFSKHVCLLKDCLLSFRLLKLHEIDFFLKHTQQNNNKQGYVYRVLPYLYNFSCRYIMAILSHTNLYEPCYYHSHQNQVSIDMPSNCALKVGNETINEGVFLYFYLWCNVSNDFQLFHSSFLRCQP